MRRYAVDTGPLVAFLDRRDAHHAWARSVLDRVPAPLVTCEAAVTEAMHLLRHHPEGSRRFLTLLSRRLVTIGFRYEQHLIEVESLLRRYASVPMSFTDACLVRMSEADAELSIITLDRDFLIYRRLGRGRLPLMHPFD